MNARISTKAQPHYGFYAFAFSGRLPLRFHSWRYSISAWLGWPSSGHLLQQRVPSKSTAIVWKSNIFLLFIQIISFRGSLLNTRMIAEQACYRFVKKICNSHGVQQRRNHGKGMSDSVQEKNQVDRSLGFNNCFNGYHWIFFYTG